MPGPSPGMTSGRATTPAIPYPSSATHGAWAGASAPGANEAVAGHVHPVELPVAVLVVERDGARRRGRGAADLGDLELDAVGQVDAHPVRGAGDRAGDRPAGRRQDAG